MKPNVLRGAWLVVVSSPVAPVEPVKRNVQAIPGLSGKYCVRPVRAPRVHPVAAIAAQIIPADSAPANAARATRAPANFALANLLFMLSPGSRQVSDAHDAAPRRINLARMGARGPP